MRIGAVSGYGNIQSIYTYSNTHYNQVQSAPVSPVKAARGTSAISEDEDRLKVGATFKKAQDSDKLEARAVEKGVNRLLDNADYSKGMDYNMSDPYQVQQKSIDGMLMAGQNIDVMA